MTWFSIDIFYGSKLVSEQPVRARDEGHANRLAAYIAATVARECVPVFLWNSKKVSWVVHSCRATMEVARQN